MIQLSHDYWKNHSFDFVGKVMSLLFNALSRFVIAFPPRSKYLFHFMALVTIGSDFGAPKSNLTASAFPLLFAMNYNVMKKNPLTQQ